MTAHDDANLMLFAGNSNPELASKVAEHLHVGLGKAADARAAKAEDAAERAERG